MDYVVSIKGTAADGSGSDLTSKVNSVLDVLVSGDTNYVIELLKTEISNNPDLPTVQVESVKRTTIVSHEISGAAEDLGLGTKILETIVETTAETFVEEDKALRILEMKKIQRMLLKMSLITL